MGATWDHPELGRFTFDDDAQAWSGTVDVPAFRAFAWDTGYSNAPRSQGRHELVFEADDEDDVPSPAMVALALEVLANQANLVPVVTQALWDDFNGHGSPGMWWHGQLAQVVAAMYADEPASGPADLLKELQVSDISVRKEVDGHDGPIVELNFHASFEEEHGVGILTDGRTVLGTGYSHGG